MLYQKPPESERGDYLTAEEPIRGGV